MMATSSMLLRRSCCNSSVLQNWFLRHSEHPITKTKMARYRCYFPKKLSPGQTACRCHPRRRCHCRPAEGRLDDANRTEPRRSPFKGVSYPGPVPRGGHDRILSQFAVSRSCLTKETNLLTLDTLKSMPVGNHAFL